MAHITINDANFYYEVHGSGTQSIVLVAGYSGVGNSWLPLVPALAKHFKVIFFDNRACGQTHDDGRELSAESMADDTIALCRALKLYKPHIVGRSMGGTIVQTIAAKYSEEISKIGILISTVKWRKAVLNLFDSAIKMQEQNVNPEIIGTFFESILLGEECLCDTMFMQNFRNINNTNPYPQSLPDQKRQFKVLLDFDGNNLLHKIKSPALVLCGKQDILALPDESEHLASEIPQAKLVALDCGHMIAIEKPDDLSQELLNFLL